MESAKVPDYTKTTKRHDKKEEEKRNERGSVVG